MALAHRLWQGAEEFTSVKILAQCLIQCEGLRALAGITLLPDQVFLSPTADTPSHCFHFPREFSEDFWPAAQTSPRAFLYRNSLGFSLAANLPTKDLCFPFSCL